MSSAAGERAKKAVIGSFLADAATAGVHWIYIQDDVAKAVKGEPNTDGPPTSKEAIFAKINAQKDGWEGNPKFKEPLDLELVTEFVEPSACPWYKVSAGALSPYGDEALSVLRSLGKEGGLFPDRYAADAVADIAASKSYVAHLSKTYRAAWEAGKRGSEASAAVLAEAESTGNNFDVHAHALARVPPIVARYYKDPTECLAKVAECVRVMQDRPVAVEQAQCLAFILCKVIHGASLRDAVAAAADPASGLADGARETAKSAIEVSGNLDPRHIGCRFGLSCALPGALTIALAVALAHPGSFRSAVRANALVAGDNCSRALAVGALLAAALDIDFSDAAMGKWKGGPAAAEVEKLAGAVLPARTAASR